MPRAIIVEIPSYPVDKIRERRKIKGWGEGSFEHVSQISKSLRGGRRRQLKSPSIYPLSNHESCRLELRLHLRITIELNISRRPFGWVFKVSFNSSHPQIRENVQAARSLFVGTSFQRRRMPAQEEARRLARIRATLGPARLASPLLRPVSRGPHEHGRRGGDMGVPSHGRRDEGRHSWCPRWPHSGEH